MNNKLKKYELSIEEKVHSIGINISTLSSLIKYLDISLNDKLDVSNMDIANLASLLKNQINTIKVQFDELECILET